MSERRPIRTVLSVAIAILVILCALGQIANWEPFGVGAWVRSAFSLFGILGAILLMCRRRLAWVFLLPWALLQTVVVITDPAGPWFYQSLHFGWKHTNSIRVNNQLIDMSGRGVNFAGLIWAAVFLVMLMFRVFPPLKPLPRPLRVTPRRAIWAGLLLTLLIAWQGYRIIERYNAPLVLTTNLPGTSVYYRDQHLGRTPLAITPTRIKAWGLPLHAGQSLKIWPTDWTQRLILYTADRQSEVILDLEAPFYAPSPKPMPTPWGLRHVSASGGVDGANREQRILIYPNDKDNLCLTIEPLQAGPYTPGQIVPLRCTIHNPTDAVSGERPQIKVMPWNFDKKWITEPAAIGDRTWNRFDMPNAWKTWGHGQQRAEVVDMQMPDQPGDYTLMAVFNLFEPDDASKLVMGSPYSNYLLVEVVQPAIDPVVMGE